MYKFLSIRGVLLAGVVLFVVVSCKTDYEKLVDRELKSGERRDTLFLGLRLGMPSKDFYSHCWELNKQKIIRQGYTNVSVLFRLTELRDSADMNFYPTFENDSIYEMRVFINYRGWAPWNKNLSPDTLVFDVIKMMKRWYGGDFIKIEFPDKGTLFVKVDKNRRITVSKDGESNVKVIFTDLVVERRKKEEIEND
jgi:hypothetical protein